MARSTRLLLVSLLALLFTQPCWAYEGSNLGYIDAVTVNGAHFEELDESEIVFYPEDLRDGVVEFRGILESESGKVPVDGLAVEITLDGGATWQRVEGHGEWAYRFRPELKRTYAFGIRVTKATPVTTDPAQGNREVQLAMGPFTLTARVEATEEGLRGRGTLDLGFLNAYLPAGAKGEKPGLEVSFSKLKPDAAMRRIEAGTIEAAVSLDVDLPEAVNMRVRSMTFSPTGAHLAGALSLTRGIHIPTVPIEALSFTPEGIKGRLLYKKRGRVNPIPILSGSYGVDFLLTSLALDIDTTAKRVALSDVDASLKFGAAFGEMGAQAVSYGEGAWSWGREAGKAVGTLTIPGTAVKIANIGGTIESSLTGLTLSGTLEIPVFNDTFTLDLTGPSALRITPSGISSKGRIILNDLNRAFALQGFTAKAKGLVLGIQNNRVSGNMTASLALERLRGASLDFTAEIRDSGLSGIKTAVGPQEIAIPGFANLHLDRSAIAVSSAGVSVSLDGYLDITHPALRTLTPDLSRDASKEGAAYFDRLGGGKMGSTLSGLKGKAGEAAGDARTGLKAGKTGLAQSAGRGMKQAGATTGALHQFAFRNLTILKDRIELPAAASGWHSFSSPMSAKMDGLSLSAESWGIGASGGSLWAGLKGSVATTGPTFASSARATAQFHLDGRFEILDFAANASLAMGPFTLHTDAVLSGGRISGSGVLVSNAAIPSLPSLLKDAEGRLHLDVRFTNLAASGGKVLSGVIDVPLPDAPEIALPLADIRLKALHISPEKALSDAEIRLKGLPGIEAISIDTLALGANGFAARGTVRPPSPLSVSLFDAPNDVSVSIRSFGYAIDTGARHFSIADLDGNLTLGEAYGGLSFPLTVADGLLHWGNTLGQGLQQAATQATGTLQATAGSLQPATGLSLAGAAPSASGLAKKLVIPGTDFGIKNPGGSLRLGEAPSITLSGVIEVPGFDAPFELPIPAETPLVISAQGIATQGKIVVDRALATIPLEGFPITPEHLGFSVAANAIDLDLAGSLVLEKFGGIALAFSADFNGFGLDALSIDMDRMATKVSLEGFADLDLKRVATGFNEDGLFVNLDCDLTLTHPMLKDFLPLSADEAKNMAASAGQSARTEAGSHLAGAGRTGRDAANAGRETLDGVGQHAAQAAAPIALRGVKIYRDALDFGTGLSGWHTLDPAAMARIDQLQLMLQKWGVGAEGDRFWVGFKGAMSAAGRGSEANGEATAQFYSDGTFRLLDMNFSGEFALGPFRLLTDAQYAGGKLSGSGMIVSDAPMPDLPACLKDDAGFLSAAVDFENLAVNTATKAITGGLVSIDTAFDLTAPLSEAQKLKMAVRKLGFSPQGLSLSGDVTLPTLFGTLELPVLQVENLKFGLNGFSGTSLLSASWPSPAPVSILESLGVKLLMSGISLSVDWSKPGLSKISLTDLQGSVDLGGLFTTLEGAAQPALAFAQGALTFTLPQASLPGAPDLGFSNIKGRILLADSGVRFSLDSLALSLTLLDTPLTVAGTGIQVGSTGLSGNFALASAVNLTGVSGFSGQVRSLGVTLAQNRVQSGSFAVHLTLQKFFNLELDMAGAISASGIDNFHIATNAGAKPPTIDRFKELATIAISDLTAGYSAQEGLSLSLYPEVTFTHAMLASLDTVRLDAVRFARGAVDFSGVTLRQQLDNASFPMGPVDVEVTEIGLTLSKTTISTTISGNVEIGPLARGAVTITASPSSFSIDRIALSYDQNGVAIGGGLEWDSGAKRFAADANLSVAGVMRGSAALELGRNTTASPTYTWWRVGLSASVGSPIPLSPIPLSIYAFNGGIAYHMKTSANGASVQFTPDRNKEFAFQAGVTLGTAGDYGYTWHGVLMLTIQPGTPITFTGETWFLKDNLGKTEKRTMNAVITIGVSEPYFALSGNAKFLIDEANLAILDVNANCSIQFGPSARDWHIFLGTKEDPLSVKAIGGFFTGDGYLMMDSSGMKFGFSQQFDLSANAGCFYGRLYGGVAMDFEGNIRPFYVDAEGRVWIGIEAGVKAFGERYAIIEAYASLAMKFHTPNPTYLRIKAKFRYSFCAGLVSGTYSNTFWVPEKPKGQEIDDPTRFPLVGYLIPSDGGSEIPRTMPFEMTTTLPVDEIFALDNGKKYMIRLLDVKNHPEYRAGALAGYGDYIDMADGHDGVNGIAVKNNRTGQDIPRQIGGVEDKDTLKVRSFDELERNASYTLYARAQLLTVNSGISTRDAWRGRPASEVFQGVAYDEGVKSATFTTANTENLAGARELIEKVFPSRTDEVVFPDTEIRIYYRVPATGQAFATTNRHYVFDSANQPVVDATEWRQGLVTENEVAATEQWVKFTKPQRPLTGKLVYKDEMTGEVRAAIIDQGHEINPFTMGECWTPDCSDQNTQVVNPSNAASPPGGAPSPSLASGSGLQAANTNATGLTQSGSTLSQQNPAVALSYRYTRYVSSEYTIEIYDREGKSLYRSPFAVSTGLPSNAAAIQASQAAQNLTQDDFENWTPGVDLNPLHAAMHVSGHSWPQGETAEIHWEQEHASFLRSIHDAFYYTGGYGACPRTGTPNVEGILESCPSARRDYEVWLIAHPRPKPVSSYGANGDLVFTFDTESPLNWDSIGLTFEVQKKAPGDSNSGTLTVTLGRKDYEVVSAPTATTHLVVIPNENLVYPGSAQLNSIFRNYYDYDRVKVKMQAVRTQTGTGGTFNTGTEGAAFFNWTLVYKSDLISYTPESCNGDRNGYTCQPAVTNFSDPYFAIYHYDYVNGGIAH